MKDKISMLVLRIEDDGDFYWNSKSFQREKDSFGDNENCVFIYFKNPTNKDISDVIKTIAEEFKESFSTSREYLLSVKDEIYNELLSSAVLFDDNAEAYDRYVLDYDSGNYSASLMLVDYEEKDIVFANTKETVTIGTFESYE